MAQSRRATLAAVAYSEEAQPTSPSLIDTSDVASTSSETGSSTTNSILSIARRAPFGISWLRGRSERPRRLSDSSFNPEAPEFRPAGMRFKRKASSSTDGPSKAGPSSAKPVNLIQKTAPIIPTKDVFGSDDSFVSASASNDAWDAVVESSEDEVDLLSSTGGLIGAAGNIWVQDQQANEELRRRGRERIEASLSLLKSKKGPSKKLSAVLIAQDEETLSASMPSPRHGEACIQYLPLCPAKKRWFDVNTPDHLTILPSHRDRIQVGQEPDMETSITWPIGKLPVELFDLITEYLSRDDVKSMRLVSQEFEAKVSRSLFHTSVVPFNTELYDMIDDDKKPVNLIPKPPDPGRNGKGKDRAIPLHQGPPLSQMDARSLHWQNARDDRDGKVYKGHGLRVFRGFGPHIKRFGMSFEVSEKQMSQPLSKKELDHVVSYHGSYDWPPMQYARFANLAGLENTADETSRMKAAFANLEIVQELALSIDSGLGWLSGPDKSLHARIFHRPSAVFGSAYTVDDRVSQQAAVFWTALQQSQRAFDPRTSMREVNLESVSLPSRLDEVGGLRGTEYTNTRLWATLPESKLSPKDQIPFLQFPGVVYTTNRTEESAQNKIWHTALVPSTLQKEQMEWLLETQWAQQAFLESYMLAVIDNRVHFSRITTLNFAKISSRFCNMLSRSYFWDALECLNDVTLLVSPDWRSVEKDDAGAVTVRPEYPSHAIRSFHRDLLRDRIALRLSIKKLTIGWVGGGEHAEGMYARNTNIMPAPITQSEHCAANTTHYLGLVFKHVEHLTLRNCWISPPSLEGLVRSHSSLSLKKLTLDSVSLIAHPRFPPLPQLQAGQQLPPAIIAQMQGMNNNHNNNHPPFQIPNMAGLTPNQLAMLHQQWQAHLQQMQQMLQANANPGNNLMQVPPLVAGIPPAALVNAGLPQGAGANNQHQNHGPPHSSHWTANHREGSWPQLLDKLSPGPTFTDYLPAPAPWELQPPPRPETTLRTIELKSCGYVRLPRHLGFDQSTLDPDQTGHVTLTPWFAKRSQCLKGMMMEVRDRYLGTIVPAIPQSEMNAMQFAWALVEGWADREKAEEATYDGCLPGGTGRVSGVIERGMGLTTEAMEDGNGAAEGAAS